MVWGLHRVEVKLLDAGTIKCLSCKRTINAGAAPPNEVPALCEDCANDEGRLESVLLELQGEERLLEDRLCTANALCMRCHSGGLTGPVLCENGECLVSHNSPSHSQSCDRVTTEKSPFSNWNCRRLVCSAALII